MKLSLFLGLFGALATAQMPAEDTASAFLEESPADIPRDRCGVVVSVNEDERLELFALGHDNQIYHKYQLTAEDWSNWANLGGLYIRGGPSVVRNADGRLQLFVRGMDRAIWHKAQVHPNGGTWSTWSCLGAPKKGLKSSPVSVLNSEGYLHVFSVGEDGELWHNHQTANDTFGTVWVGWESLGGSCTSLPSVELDAESLLHAFVRGPDKALYHKAQVGKHEPRKVSWGEWDRLSGTLASGPRVPSVSNAVNLLEIFARGSDKAYWHTYQVAGHDKGVSWREWTPLGGVFSSGPEAILNMDGLMDVFGRGPDKAIWHKGQSHVNGTVTWNRWSSLGGVVSTGATVVQRADGLLEVFARGTDKNIWHKSQVIANGTLSFGNWKFLGGSTRSFPC